MPIKPPQRVATERLKASEFIQVIWIHVPFGYVGGLLLGYFIKYQRIATAEKEVLPKEEETAMAKSTDHGTICLLLTVFKKYYVLSYRYLL